MEQSPDQAGLPPAAVAAAAGTAVLIGSYVGLLQQPENDGVPSNYTQTDAGMSSFPGQQDSPMADQQQVLPGSMGTLGDATAATAAAFYHPWSPEAADAAGDGLSLTNMLGHMAAASLQPESAEGQPTGQPGQAATAGTAVAAPSGLEEYMQPPFSTPALVQAGDALWQEAGGQAFQLAVKSGKYGGQQQQHILSTMWDHIQSVDWQPAASDSTAAAAGATGEPSTSSSSSSRVVAQIPSNLPAMNALSALERQQFLLRPPVPNTTAEAVRSSSGGSSSGAGPAGGTHPLRRLRAAAAPQGQGQGPVRNFSSYQSRKPAVLDDGSGRCLFNLVMPLEQHPEWQYRLWVCGVRVSGEEGQVLQQGVQQQFGVEQGYLQQAQLQQVQPGAPNGVNGLMNWDALVDQATNLDVSELQWLSDVSFPGLAAEPAAEAAEGAAAAAALLAGAQASTALQHGAAPAARAAGSAPAFHSSHTLVAAVEVSASKSSSKARSAGTAGSSGQAPPVKQQYLLDVSVGWCVLEEKPKEARPPKAKKSGGGQTAAESTTAKRSRSSSAELHSLGAAMPGIDALHLASSSSGPLGAGAASSGQAVAAPTAAATAPKQPDAASAGVAAAGCSELKLSERLQRLSLNATAYSPKQLVALFHPKTTVVSAAAGQAANQLPTDPAGIAQLQRLLLQRDVRDRYERNVLHLAATQRADATADSTARQLELLSFLLSDAVLLAVLQHQVNDNGATPLMVAATWGQAGVYGRLLDVATLDVLEKQTHNGWTVLHRLASSAADASPHDRQRFMQCIFNTIDRMLVVAAEAAAAEGEALTPQQQLEMTSQLVQLLVQAPEPTGPHYKGQQMMQEAMEYVKQKMQGFSAQQ